jgi:iron(III) transport system substrate-binding protein
MEEEKMNSRIISSTLNLVVAMMIATIALPPDASAGSPDEEKVLNMYVAYGKPELVAAQFEKATGIKIQFLTISSGEVLTRLRAEKANPRTDVWFGGGSDAFIDAKADGIIMAYRSPNASRVAKSFKDPDDYWTGVSLVVVGFVVNENRLSKKKLATPMSWADLANPIYKGEVIASNPNTGGTAYTTVSGLLQILGEEKGFSFLDKMYANIPFLEKTGSAPPTKALQGEFGVGIAPDPHITKMDNPNAPVAVVFPKDGVLAWPSPVAIVTGAKHPKNASRFVDWCLTPEGQQVLMQAAPRVPTTDVPTIAGVPNLSQLNLVAYDHVKWGKERKRVLTEFNRRYPQYQ